MISRTINLSTGPVGITPLVQRALQQAPVSHRSATFGKLYRQTTELLSAAFNVRQSFILTGSGTLANEAMLQEVKQLPGQGLILSNGEFGGRLIDQSRRIGLNFITHELEWGQAFDMQQIESMITRNVIRWLLFCHCETSTGVINDLVSLTSLCKRHDVASFVDCMSTAGTRPIDLSAVTMASASSGKGLASVPGLAIVFANVTPLTKSQGPGYLDLGKYAASNGIPFTLSSNLLKALHVSIGQKLRKNQFELSQYYGAKFFNEFDKYQIAPFSSPHTNVFTLIPKGKGTDLASGLKRKKLLLSSESEYLIRRGWSQMATFGCYTECELKYVLRNLAQTLAVTSRTFS